MMIRNLILLLTVIIPCMSCADSSINKNEGRKIADKKLQELSSSNYFSEKHVDVSALPEPTLEFQGSKLLVDYKDIDQNAWIVIIIHPDGSSEVSYTKINER